MVTQANHYGQSINSNHFLLQAVLEITVLYHMHIYRSKLSFIIFEGYTPSKVVYRGNYTAAASGDTITNDNGRRAEHTCQNNTNYFRVGGNA